MASRTRVSLSPVERASRVPMRHDPPACPDASGTTEPTPTAASGCRTGASHVTNIDTHGRRTGSPALRTMRNLVPRSRHRVVWFLLVLACSVPAPDGPPTEIEFRRLLALGNGSNVAVTSERASDPRLRPRTFAGPPEQVRTRILDVIDTLPRWHVAGTNGAVVWVTRTTRLFRFVDDLFILIEPRGDSSVVLVRSASRVGKGDLGQNRRNIAELWIALAHSP